jgi:excisionase family DNA binding protein
MDTQVDFQNRVFSITEAAEWLRISRSFLYSLIAEKKLRPIKFGKRSVITGAEIARFIKVQEGNGA